MEPGSTQGSGYSDVGPTGEDLNRDIYGDVSATELREDGSRIHLIRGSTTKWWCLGGRSASGLRAGLSQTQLDALRGKATNPVPTREFG